MNWDLEDFTAATLLLASAGIAMAVIYRTVHRRAIRMLGVVAVVLILITVWAHLAVGVF